LVAAERAALVYLHAAGAELTAPLRPPARPAAARLAASLAARGLTADARGRLVLAHADGSADAPARALAAAGALPTVLAVAARAPDVDELLSAQDAILVALPPTADPALAELALSGARELCRSAVAVTLALDAVTRALALGGWRAPRAVSEAVEVLVG
jgi:hypothetical protein